MLSSFFSTFNPSSTYPASTLVIHLRNLNPSNISNETRLQGNGIETTIIIAVNETVFTLQIPIIPFNYPLKFKRFQFPVTVCSAITINKPQGQSLKMTGIEVREDFFS